MILNGWASSALATISGAFATNAREALEQFPAVVMPQFVFAGLWIRIDTIPVALRWIQYIVPIKYAINIMYYGEFLNVKNGKIIMATNNVDDSLLWEYYVILIGIIVIARILGAMALRLSARKTVY